MIKKQKVDSVKALHIFELINKLIEILRKKHAISFLWAYNGKRNATIQTKIIKSRVLKLTNAASGLGPKRIGVRLRKSINFKLEFGPGYIKKMQNEVIFSEYFLRKLFCQ